MTNKQPDCADGSKPDFQEQMPVVKVYHPNIRGQRVYLLMLTIIIFSLAFFCIRPLPWNSVTLGHEFLSMFGPRNNSIKHEDFSEFPSDLTPPPLLHKRASLNDN